MSVHTDYFDQWQLLPKQAQKLINDFNKSDETPDDWKTLSDEMLKLGYTCVNDCLYKTAEIQHDFKKWLKSEQVVKVGKDLYIEQSSGFSKYFTEAELFEYYKREFLQ